MARTEDQAKKKIVRRVAACAVAVVLACAASAKERQVGLFYFLWLGEHGRTGPYDVSKILAADPDAGRKPNSPVWGGHGVYHHWGEPLYGYYFSNDEWVVRRHMKLIMQCGVVFLFFDTTNAVIYERNAKLVMRILKEYHDAGWKIPKVMFYTNSASGKMVQRIYDAIYGPGFAKETWFRLDGKPVIVAKEEECSPDMRAFFTVVKSQWPNEKSKKGGWPWMDFSRPQRVFEGEKVAKSVMNVSVAQHPQLRFGDSAMYGEKGNCGRAFHNGENDPAPGAWKKGYNFQEQWDRAHEAKPDIVLVTGWNEWIAGRWQRKDRADRPVMFVDCANAEYSRDIEMMKGGYSDNFYLQMVRNIAAFKGKEATLTEPALEGSGMTYSDLEGDAICRDFKDFSGKGHYSDQSARNDIVNVTVSHDETSVSFRIRTAAPITRHEKGDLTWMNILVSVSDTCEKSFPYDYIIGRHPRKNGRTSVERVTDSGTIKTGHAFYDVSGKEMIVKVPINDLGLSSENLRLSFKVSDHVLDQFYIMDYYISGDSAPIGRLSYKYNPTY